MSSHQSALVVPAPHDRIPLALTAVCWALMLVDGFDVISFGTVVPSLLHYQPWHLTAGEVGRIGAAALIGMAIGAIAAGQLANALGHRRAIMACLGWFSLTVGAAALAPNPEMLAGLRFAAGLGLGGLLPTASALVIAHAPTGRRTFVYAVMFSGYPLGGIVAAAVARRAIEPLGFRSMFAFGLFALLLIPFVLRYLPGDRSQPSKSSASTVSASHRGELSALFRRAAVPATVLFWIATFLVLLVIYGLYTWLPEIMQESGYGLGSALVFLLVLNVGGLVGMLGAGRAADRFGTRRVAVIASMCAAAAIVGLSLKPPTMLSYVLIVFAGAGAIGGQLLVNACVAEYYPSDTRAAALGWSLGIGRLGAIAGPPVGAFIVTAALGVSWHFYTFGAASLFAAAAIAAIPRSISGSILVPASAPS